MCDFVEAKFDQFTILRDNILNFLSMECLSNYEIEFNSVPRLGNLRNCNSKTSPFYLLYPSIYFWRFISSRLFAHRMASDASQFRKCRINELRGTIAIKLKGMISVSHDRPFSRVDSLSNFTCLKPGAVRNRSGATSGFRIAISNRIQRELEIMRQEARGKMHPILQKDTRQKDYCVFQSSVILKNSLASVKIILHYILNSKNSKNIFDKRNIFTQFIVHQEKKL